MRLNVYRTFPMKISLKEGIYEDSGDDKYPPSIFYEFGNEDDGFDTPRDAVSPS